MRVIAITQVSKSGLICHTASNRALAGLHPRVPPDDRKIRSTNCSLQYVRDALADMEVAGTGDLVARRSPGSPAADEEIYAKTLA